MKKITLIAFALGALSLASCKKTRTCTCTSTQTTTTLSGAINTVDVTTDVPYTATEELASATKRTAKGKRTCNSRTETTSDTFSGGGVTTKQDVSTVYDCTIK
jgi:hypothetical protein